MGGGVDGCGEVDDVVEVGVEIVDGESVGEGFGGVVGEDVGVGEVDDVVGVTVEVALITKIYINNYYRR